MTFARQFDRDYFENGILTGKSLYENYRWIPERSIPEAKAISRWMGLNGSDLVLDYGCAKGFGILGLFHDGHFAVGCDVSRYAVENCAAGVVNRIFYFPDIPHGRADVGIAKDVLEHSQDLDWTLEELRWSAERWFVVVPLGDFGCYRISCYHDDPTHRIIQDEDFWMNSFRKAGFSIVKWAYSVFGVKDKWVRRHPTANLFVDLRSE